MIHQVKLVCDVAVICKEHTLLVRYNDVNDYDHQKGWFIPDDFIHELENPDDAALRILKEQLDYTPQNPDDVKFCFFESFKVGDKSWHLVTHYIIKLNEMPEINPSKNIAELKWFDINNLPSDKEIAHHGWAKYTLQSIQSILNSK
jgi:ADP-ribose pyrophosphatase YjhB (NUDIX family)